MAGAKRRRPSAVSEKVRAMAALTDLLVIGLDPAAQALSSDVITWMRYCTRPILTVPSVASNFQHALLAYDGSSKSKEALFVAAYLGERWKTRLTLITVSDPGRVDGTAQDYAAQHCFAQVGTVQIRVAKVALAVREPLEQFRRVHRPSFYHSPTRVSIERAPALPDNARRLLRSGCRCIRYGEIPTIQDSIVPELDCIAPAGSQGVAWHENDRAPFVQNTAPQIAGCVVRIIIDVLVKPASSEPLTVVVKNDKRIYAFNTDDQMLRWRAVTSAPTLEPRPTSRR